MNLDEQGYAAMRRAKGTSRPAPGNGAQFDPQPWMSSALCAQVPIDDAVFYPKKGGTARRAKRLCIVCEVRPDCAAYALCNAERDGVWGGMSERERHRLLTSGWAAGDPIPDVRLNERGGLCPDCGKTCLDVPAHQAWKHPARAGAA